MALVQIPFPASSAPGTYPTETRGRLLNCVVVKEGDQTLYRRCAGLAPFVTLPESPIRGMLEVGAFLFVAAGRSVYRVSRGGVAEKLYGDVTGSGPVWMARNNATPAQIALCGEHGAQIVDGRGVIRAADGDVPLANSVGQMGPYLVFTTISGAIYASERNSQEVEPLSFSSAESSADELLTGFVSGGLYYAMGSGTIEAWQDVGLTPFAMTRLPSVIPVGLIAPRAVAGSQREWDRPGIFVASDCTVRVLSGLQTETISTPSLERRIAAADKTTLRAHVYQSAGRSFWVLSSSDWTWQYDAAAGVWSERASEGATRWMVGDTTRFGDDWIAADMASGGIYRISAEAMTELGAPLPFGADSAPVRDMPARFVASAAFFEFTRGHGDAGAAGPTLENPQAMLSWSRDGGATWAGPMHRPLGHQGRFGGALRVNRLGMVNARGLQLRWRISDPVDASFVSARVEVEQRAP